MSNDKNVPKTQATQHLIKSATLGSELRKTADLVRALNNPELENLRVLNKYSEIFKSIRPIIIPKFEVPQLDFSGLTEALQAPSEMGKRFSEICSPLALSQNSLLSSIQFPNPKFQGLLANLAAYAPLLGEFETENKEEIEESPEQKALSQEVHNRFELVQFLPLRLMDAVADNPDLLRGLDPRDFEKLVADLLAALEFENVILTPRSADGGRDVLATKIVSGIPMMFSFECKRYSNKIGLNIMRGLLGSVVHSSTKTNIGVLVTTSTFTRGARNFMLSEPLVDGKDFNDLVLWLNTYKQLKR